MLADMPAVTSLPASSLLVPQARQALSPRDPWTEFTGTSAAASLPSQVISCR